MPNHTQTTFLYGYNQPEQKPLSKEEQAAWRKKSEAEQERMAGKGIVYMPSTQPVVSQPRQTGPAIEPGKLLHFPAVASPFSQPEMTPEEIANLVKFSEEVAAKKKAEEEAAVKAQAEAASAERAAMNVTQEDAPPAGPRGPEDGGSHDA